MPNKDSSETFAFQAQNIEGHAVVGRVESENPAVAVQQLHAQSLRVTAVNQLGSTGGSRIHLGAVDFLAFNQQLARLTAGSMPVERSLRILAGELGGKGRRQLIEEIALDLEKGVPLGEAFDRRRNSFPPLYGRLIDAGIRGNCLSGVLLNVGRHVEMLHRLRSAVWRVATYPLCVLGALLPLLGFIWMFLIPRMLTAEGSTRTVQTGWGYTYFEAQNKPDPEVMALIDIARMISYGIMEAIAAAVVIALLLWMRQRSARPASWSETIVLSIPFLGSALRCNMLARWCDALHLGIAAGMDLPSALSLVHEVTDSPRLQADSVDLSSAVGSGDSLEHHVNLRLLPPMVPVALQMGIEKSDLPDATAMLARMYQEQAEARLDALPQILAPLLLIITAVCVGLAVFAAILPLIAVIKSFR